MRNSPDNPLIIASSTKEEGPELVKFVETNHVETKGFVFPRKPEIILSHAEAGLMTTVREKKTGELLSMSGLYILGYDLADPPPPDRINAIIHRRHNGDRPEDGVTWELGTVIKKLVDNADDPKGYGRLTHFGLAPFRLLRLPPRIPADIAVTEIHHLNRDTVISIRDGRMPDYIEKARLKDPNAPIRFEEGSPLNFPQIPIPHPDMLAERAKTSLNPLINHEWDFYRIPVRCLVPLAETYKQILDQGFISDFRPKEHIGYNPHMKIYVDYSQLNFRGANGLDSPVSLKQLVDFILDEDHRPTFSNAQLYDSWREAARYVDLRIGDVPTGRLVPTIQGVSGTTLTLGEPLPPGITSNPESSPRLICA